MDGKTLEYYNEHAEEVAARYEAAGDGVESLLPFVFKAGDRVLDIGSGSGRNLAALRKVGADAVGIEPSERLRAEAVKRYPQLRGRIVAGSLPADLAAAGSGAYDGILLSAVIMHIPDAELFDTALAMRELLADGGTLLLSLSTERDDTRPHKGREPRDTHGRLMVLRSVLRVRLLFERLGFVLESEHSSADSAGRNGVCWTSLVFRSGRTARSGAVDRLESILNTDRKAATFRLALVRAFCDLASTRYNTVSWTHSGKVSLPLAAVCDLWIRYYWPLFGPGRIIPQISGESKGAKPVAFRRAVTALVGYYRTRGGLGALLGDLHGNRLDAEAAKLHLAARDKIADAVARQVAEAAGGAIGRGELACDPRTDAILIDPDLWREIVLKAHWVRDAVILRWAEMTAGLARVEDGLSVGGALQRLLESTSPLRSDHEIRFIYEERRPLECVWSGKRLASDFSVDHALPFELWQDSSWWNLLPASRRVTGTKGGKLPTTELVRRRKEAIVSSWELLRRAAPERFGLDAHRLTGRELPDDEPGWQNELFSSFIEAIEYTAASRGVPRWEP